MDDKRLFTIDHIIFVKFKSDFFKIHNQCFYVSNNWHIKWKTSLSKYNINGTIHQQKINRENNGPQI